MAVKGRKLHVTSSSNIWTVISYVVRDPAPYIFLTFKKGHWTQQLKNTEG